MPIVRTKSGVKKFPYTAKGKTAAKKIATKTGMPMKMHKKMKKGM